MAMLEIKITAFACLLSNEGCDSFVKHLNLELAPNKTNEGINNGTSSNTINHRALSLAQQYSDYARFHWSVGRWRWKGGGRGSLDGCLTLSTLLMGTKLDCQKLKHCLSKYFFVDSSLSTKIMS